MTATLLTLATIFGLSVAALVGGYRKYMFYRSDMVEGFKLRTWYVGYVSYVAGLKIYCCYQCPRSSNCIVCYLQNA